MKKFIVKSFALILSGLITLSLAGCGAKVEYESYYEGGPDGGNTSVSSNAGNTSNGQTDNTGNKADTSSKITKKVGGNVTDDTASSSASKTQKKSGKTTNMTPDQFLESMPENLKGSTIKMFFWDDLRSTVYRTPLKKFEQKTGIKVEIEIAEYTTYIATLAARISAGKSPDIVKMIENNIGNVSNLQPIDNIGYDFNDKNWDKALMKLFTYNGRCYAFNVDKSPNKNVGIFTYNKKALKRANMTKDDPYTIWKNNPKSWTWSKFWELCNKFVKANSGKEGYYGTTWGTEDGYVKAFGVCLWRYDPDKGKVVNCSNTPEAVKRYGELIDSINKKWSTSTADSTGFDSGKILFAWGYSSTAEKNGVGGENLKKGNNLGFVPMPTDSTYTPLFTTSAYGVPIGAKNGGAVPYLVRYLFSPESINEDDFYYNEESKNVVTSVINKNNFYFGNGYHYQVWQDMIKGTGANVKSVLDSYQGMINDTVSLANESMKKLNK